MTEGPPSFDEDLLGPDQRAFFVELCRMLELGVTGSGMRMSRRLEHSRGIHVLIVELTQPAGNVVIEASVAEGEITISVGEGDAWNTHWDFAPTWNDVYGTVPNRVWTTLAVDFIAELLHGEVRVHATYRGNHLVKVYAEVVGSHGDVVTAGTVGSLNPRGLNFLAKRRVEERTVRFAR